jgi:GT2 family glycosyltransferase
MGVEVSQNFDWNITNRKIMVFISNYHRHEMVEFGIRNLATVLPPEDYIIIVGNDNCHYDFSYLKDFGVRYFSLDTGRSLPRNSAFIRNYAIKRCQAKLFMHKDPEVVVLGDFLKSAVDKVHGWKTGYALNLSEDTTKRVLAGGKQEILPLVEGWLQPQNRSEFTKLSYSDGSYLVTFNEDHLFDPQRLIAKILSGKLNVSNWVSYALGIETRILQKIHGYDESFTNYGFEDSDMIVRLMKMGYGLRPEHSCVSVHLHHASTADKHIQEMQELFRGMASLPVERNKQKWGEGI